MLQKLPLTLPLAVDTDGALSFLHSAGWPTIVRPPHELVHSTISGMVVSWESRPTRTLFKIRTVAFHYPRSHGLNMFTYIPQCPFLSRLKACYHSLRVCSYPPFSPSSTKASWSGFALYHLTLPAIRSCCLSLAAADFSFIKSPWVLL